MGKKIIIVGLLAAMLSTGGAVYAQNTDIGRTLVLSAGGGGYFGYQLVHSKIFVDGNSLFNGIETDSAMIIGAPLFVRLDLLTYLAVEASAFYKFHLTSDAGGVMGAGLSVYGQFPKEAAPGITLFPFVGVGYEMPLFLVNDGMVAREGNSADDLLLKLGLGLNGKLAGNLRLNFRLGYDVLLYNKALADYSKSVSEGTLINLKHTPSIFLGVSYAFFRI